MTLKRIYFFVLLLFLCQLGYSTIITVKDKTSKTSLSFSILSIHNNKSVTDIFGRIETSHVGVCQVYRYDYYPKTINIQDQSDSIVVYLEPKEIRAVTETTLDSRIIINKVIGHKALNAPEKGSEFSYDTYNKLIVTSNNMREAKSKLSKLLSNRLATKINSIDSSHHFVLGESITQRSFKDPLHEEEVIKYSRLVGVKKANVITVNSQINSLSLYTKFITIAAKDYTNPLFEGAFHRYKFDIVDTIDRESDRLYYIQFNPKSTARFESLKGVYVVSSKDWGLYGAILTPASSAKTEILLIQQSQYIQNRWFPEFNLAKIIFADMDQSLTNLIIKSQTHIKNINFDTSFTTQEFSDISIYYDKETTNENQDESFWAANRSIPFTDKDYYTYKLYDNIGELEDFGRYIKLMENLYNRKLYFNYFDVNLRRVLALNEHEGLRLGIGIETNESMLKNHSFNGYIGYGLTDNDTKYGIGYETKINDKDRLSVSYHNDVLESGKVSFFNDKPQYSSEWLRKLRVRLMDRERKFEAAYRSHIFKYTDIFLGLSSSTVNPTYAYEFQNRTSNSFHFTEITSQIRYAFGERYFALEDEAFPFPTKYPVLYVNLTQGIRGLNPEDISYSKIDFKLEYKHRFIRTGASIIQLNYGLINGQVPYFKLYNGKGSGRILTVAHNSFETMSYNEFLSDNYFSLFFTHDFGDINFLQFTGFKPRAHLAFNAGWGMLSNPEAHEGVPVRTMERGYFEAGGLIKNLVQLKISVVKMGFGIGYYYRFGPYAQPTFFENSKVKIATTFGF